MTCTSVPVIVVCCYILGEIIKLIFKNKKQAYRAIPIVLSFIGGMLGIVIFKSNPEMIFEAANIWSALGIGIISGASATGANQIIKQIFYKNDNGKEGSEDDSNS